MVHLSAFFVNEGCAMPDTVRCGDCGLLTIRKLGTHETMEVVKQWRRTGEYTDDHPRRPANVFCSIASESFPGSGTVQNERESLSLMDKEIECPRFRKWIPGKSPKEHEEMSILEAVRSEQKSFEDREETRRVEWRKEDRLDRLTSRILAIVALGVSILSAAVAWLSRWQ